MLSWQRRAASAAIAFGLLLHADPGRAAATDVTLAIPSQTLSIYAAAAIAEEAGFFRAAGLNVKAIKLAGVASNNAVINGSVDFLLGTASTYLNGVAHGQRLLLIANLINLPTTEVVMRRDVADKAGITEKTPLIDRMKALKGLTIGTGGIGNITHAWLRLVAKRAGLDPDADIVLAPMEPGALYAALSANRIDGYSDSPPFTTQAVVQSNALMIASAPAGDLPEYLPVDGTVLQTRREVCEKDRETCARLVSAFQATANFIHQKPDETWAILAKTYAAIDPRVLKAAWAVIGKAHTTDLKITEIGLINSEKFSLDAGLLDKKDMITDFTGLYTNEFVK